MYTFTYKGKIPSLNSWYSSTHWSSRNSDKTKFLKIFNEMFSKEKIEYMDAFRIELEYNSRVDPDNTISLLKIFVDSIKGKYVKDDTKLYYKGLKIEPNLELPSYTYIIKLYPLTNGNEKGDKGLNRVKDNKR